jgi:hypothetical protein
VQLGLLASFWTLQFGEKTTLHGWLASRIGCTLGKIKPCHPSQLEDVGQGEIFLYQSLHSDYNSASPADLCLRHF